MKNKFIILTGTLLFAFSHLFAQNFEGTITMNMFTADKNERSNIVWKMKNGNNRMEYTGSQNDKPYSYVFIFNNNETKVKILTETNGQKMVYTSNMPPSNVDKGMYYDHSYTSSNKLIDKYHAEQVTLKAADKRTTCWVSKDVPVTIEMLPGMLKANGVLTYFLTQKLQGFPMEIESFSSDGKLIMSQKMTSVKPGAISDNEFVVGSEYLDPAKVMKVQQAPAPAPQK
jgi:hypothetical protein